MPQKFTFGLVQMSCGPIPEDNLQKALTRVADAASKGAQVVCLPELFQTQYFCQREDHALFDLAEPIPGPTTEKLSAVAKKHGVVLVASLFEKRSAGRSELHATLSANEKRRADLLLQILDLLAERGLGGVQALRRAGEVQLLRHSDEIAQMS